VPPAPATVCAGAWAALPWSSRPPAGADHGMASTWGEHGDLP